jgi:hypothetical protein
VVICPHIAATLNNSLKSALPGHLRLGIFVSPSPNTVSLTHNSSRHYMLPSLHCTFALHMSMCMCMMTTAAIERPGSRSRAV